jgi:uncharacterized protein YciI
MLFLVVCHDLPGSSVQREELMPLHGPHVRPHLKDWAFGGWLTKSGPTCGSMVVTDGSSREAVEAIFRADP